ncbi:MAG: TonB-dependent receptor plug domain-containing protein [Gammaproteobacteria bacterium]|nr:TonB-dependent receptor plug domain-containing protein [Gammaproteobacteria bacterium]
MRSKLARFALFVFTLSCISIPTFAAELEEVIVTAQKREQSLQDVSLAVTAFSQDYMDRIGANNAERLDLLTPGMEWGQFGLGAKVSIRGQGVANFEANTDGPVGTFVDGIYLGRGQQAWTVLSDVERVEVLRGPQGTLFGRNTTGGSINIVTNKPGKEFDAAIGAEVGNYSRYQVNGMLNIPLSDTLSSRFVFHREEHDGFLENQFPGGNDYMDEDMTYGRAAFRFDNDSDLVVDLAIDYWEQDNNGAAFSGVKFFDQDTPGTNTWAGALSGAALPADTNEDWKFNADTQSRQQVESLSVVGTIEYDAGWATLKSITGYSDYEQFAGGDSDFSTLPLADLTLDTKATVFSQEFQIQSNDSDSKLNWMLGFYYLDEEIEELFRFDFLLGGFDFSTRDGTAKAESVAGFGQFDYSFTDQLRLIFGFRYTVDDKQYNSTDVARMDTRGTVNGDESFDEFTWRAGFEYDWTEDAMVYFNVSTGFKSGGFNRFQPPVGAGGGVGGGAVTVNYDLVFAPETITNYEGGIKADWLDNRLRTNLAIYYNEIEDLQAYAFDNSLPSSVTTNAGAASTFGIELESTFYPVPEAQLQAIVAHMDAEYDEYATFNNGSQNIDASGNTRELSPKWKTTFTGRYDFALGEYGTLSPYIQFTYKSKYFVTAANESLFGLDRQDSYTQTDIKLLWTSNDEHWSGELYVQNIEDEFAKTGGFLATNGYWLSYGPEPRTFGLRLSYDY